MADLSSSGGWKKMPTRADFQRVLNSIFNQAESKGLKFVDVTAGDLHRKVGGYPGPNHRMPLCCSVMKQNMQEGDIILYQPPSGQGASLRIRYKLPRKARSKSSNYMSFSDERISERYREAAIVTPPSKKFEKIAREVLSDYFRTRLRKGRIPGVPKEFDMVSEDRKIVGDAKYLTMVRGKHLPPAKFSMIAEHVWLLEKCPASHKFLVFGNDSRVPREWLKRYGHLVNNVTFFFLDESTKKLERLN